MSPIERSGGGGGSAAAGLVKLFDSTLNASATTLGTGANGIAGGHADLKVFLRMRTDEPVNFSSVILTVNGDSSAIYDRSFIATGGGGPAQGNSVGQTGWVLAAAAANLAAGTFALWSWDIPFYTDTNRNKTSVVLGGNVDSGGVQFQMAFEMLYYRSTNAITQMTATAPATFNLVAGTRLEIYGTQ